MNSGTHHRLNNIYYLSLCIHQLYFSVSVSETCGVGYQARWRIPTVTRGQNSSQLETEIRKCVINLAVDCKNPAAGEIISSTGAYRARKT